MPLQLAHEHKFHRGSRGATASLDGRAVEDFLSLMKRVSAPIDKQEDPRIERCKKHELIDILFLSICAVLSGAEGWEDIEDFGHAKVDWLKRYLPFENGIPKHDTIAIVKLIKSFN